jgi:transposase
MKKSRYSPEVRERSVRMVFERREQHGSQWSAIESIAGKIGCSAPTLLSWVKQHEIDSGKREGVTTTDAERARAREQGVAPCHRTNCPPQNPCSTFDWRNLS